MAATYMGGSCELFLKGDLEEIRPGGNERLIAGGILKLMKDNSRRTKIAQEAKRIISVEFDWAHKIAEIEQYYQKLLLQKI